MATEYCLSLTACKVQSTRSAAGYSSGLSMLSVTCKTKHHQLVLYGHRQCTRCKTTQQFICKSSGVCAYFLVLRAFVFMSFLMILLGSIYQLVLSSKFCTKKVEECEHKGAIPVVDYQTLLSESQINSVVTLKLIKAVGVLALLMYVVILVGNVLVVWRLVQLHRRCRPLFQYDSLVVTAEWHQLEALLVEMEIQLEAYRVVPLQDIQKEYKLRATVQNLYYTIKSLEVLDSDAKRLAKLTIKLTECNNKLQEVCQLRATELNGSFIVTFREDKKCRDLEDLLKRKGVHYQLVKYPDNIRWEIAGSNITRRKDIFIQILIVVLLVLVVIGMSIPIGIEYALEGLKAFEQFGFWGEFMYYIGPIVVSIVSHLTIFIVKQGCKNIKTRSAEYRRLLLSNSLFTQALYIFVPLLLLLLSTEKVAMTAAVLKQATIIIIFQMVIGMVDIPYYLWKTRKSLMLGNSFEAFRYNQHGLHGKVQCLEYPILKKLLVLLRICSYAYGFSFVSPFVPILLFVCFSILYIFEKRNILLHYRPVEFDISVLLMAYLQLSCIGEFLMGLFLIMYLLTQYQAPTWIAILVIVLIIPSLVAKIVLYRTRHPKEHIRKQAKQTVPTRTSTTETVDRSFELSLISSKSVGSTVQSHLPPPEFRHDYGKKYTEFLAQMRNTEVFGQIDLLLHTP